MIIFLAFCVILVTLVLQGLTLPPLIRALGLAGAPTSHPEEKEARHTILQAALTHLEAIRNKDDSTTAEVYADLALHYRRRLATLNDGEEGDQDNSSPDFDRLFVDLSRELLRVERQTAVQLRNQRRISDELLREMERELDLEEARLVAKQERQAS
jgi:CPA1 family monovalent cation:H+ antiporter